MSAVLNARAVAVSLSGGVDSTAALVWAVHQGLSVTALNCSSETEHPATDSYVRLVCERLGVSLRQAHTPNSFAWFCDCVARSRDYREAFTRFYERVYHRPFRRMLRLGRYDAVVLGYRRAEHQHLNGKSRRERIVPVYDWSKEKIREFVTAGGLPLHPCYSQTDFIKEPVRESGWIDFDIYGLFHLADRGGSELDSEAVRTLLWLERYYPALHRKVADRFPAVIPEVERVRHRYAVGLAPSIAKEGEG